MKLENSFEVAAPVERVWETLIDLEQVAPCLPGAAITGHDEDGTYHGTFQVKLGPTTASYRGTVRIQEADAESRTATLAARGSDKRGQGGASATIVNRLHATEGGGTRVEAETDFTITGRLASFGRGGMIKDISNKLLGQFADCLQARLTAEPEAAVAAAPAEGTPGPSPGASQAAPEGAAPAGAWQPAPEGAAPAGAPQPAPAPPPPRLAAPPPQAAPIKGGSLVLSILADRLRALVPVVQRALRTLLARVRQRRSG